MTAPIFKGLELWSSADCWAMSCLINVMFSSTFSYQEIHKQKQISEDAYNHIGCTRRELVIFVEDIFIRINLICQFELDIKWQEFGCWLARNRGS